MDWIIIVIMPSLMLLVVVLSWLISAYQSHRVNDSRQASIRPVDTMPTDSRYAHIQHLMAASTGFPVVDPRDGFPG